MIDDAVVLIPFAGDGQAERMSSLDWCRNRWTSLGLATHVAPGALPWSKGLAIQEALHYIPPRHRTLIIADADVWIRRFDLTRLDHCERFAYEHGSWAVPAARVIRLTPARSSWLKCRTDAEVDGWEHVPDDFAEPVHRQHPGGGLTVVHRDAYAYAPMDPRFIGWGHEDDAWSYALHTLIGEPLHAAGTLYHLWHQPQERQTRIHGSEANRALYSRYADARGDRHATRAIIDEWRTP